MYFAGNILKKRVIPLSPLEGGSVCGFSYSKALAVSALVAELANYGYGCSLDLFQSLQGQSDEILRTIHTEVREVIGDIVTDGKFDPLYPNFPNIPDVSHLQHRINSWYSLITGGEILFDGVEVGSVETYFKDFDKLVPLDVSGADPTDIIKPLLAAMQPFSVLDKAIVKYAMDSGYLIDYKDVKFGENKIFVAETAFESGVVLPRNPTEILKLLVSYNGGSIPFEKVKTVKFRRPTRAQIRGILSALNKMANTGGDILEDSFKTHSELWIKALYKYNPTHKTSKRYPELYDYVQRLRNDRKGMKTFASRVEAAISAKSLEVFSLMKKRVGLFVRSFNRLEDVYGKTALDELLSVDLSCKNLVDLYNYFHTRRTSTTRNTVLASSKRNSVSTYDALEAWGDPKVDEYQALLKEKFPKKLGKVFVDQSLYYTPFSTNNRASQMSTTSAVIGETIKIPDGVNRIASYVFWHGIGIDIDSSAHILSKSGYQKIGWNAAYKGKGLVYSGDNQGSSTRNAEYMLMDLPVLEKNGVDWVIMDAYFYSPSNAKFSRKGLNCRAGFSAWDRPMNASKVWTPEDLQHSFVISEDANNLTLFALNVRERKVMALGVSLPFQSNVSGEETARLIHTFLLRYYTPESWTVDWSKLNIGHFLELISEEVVDYPEDADIVFGEDTLSEEVAQYL